MENTKKHRVPHCRECNRCKSITAVGTNVKEYRCYKDKNCNEYGEIVGILGVDYPPKTSPKWCPKRINSKGEIEDDDKRIIY